MNTLDKRLFGPLAVPQIVIDYIDELEAKIAQLKPPAVPETPAPQPGPELLEKAKEFTTWANGQPVMVSLLYDLDLLPEQVEVGSVEWAKMLMVVQHFKSYARELSLAAPDVTALDAEIEMTQARWDSLMAMGMKPVVAVAKIMKKYREHLAQQDEERLKKNLLACMNALAESPGPSTNQIPPPRSKQPLSVADMEILVPALNWAINGTEHGVLNYNQWIEQLETVKSVLEQRGWKPGGQWVHLEKRPD